MGAWIGWNGLLLQAGMLFVGLAGVGVADERQGRLYVPPPGIFPDARTDIPALYRGREPLLAEYADAMAEHRREAVRNPVAGDAGSGFERDPVKEGGWTFIGADGDMVERRQDGSLAISRNDHLANWYAEIECRVSEWPKLSCNDGRSRTISAPNATSIRIDGETFGLAGLSGQPAEED